MEEQGFDLDAITEAELEESSRAVPFYDLQSLDRVLRRPELLPPGVTAEPLQAREYKYSAPGMREALRVTTDPEFFDQHSSSVELWSPGSPLFPEPEPALGAEAMAPTRRSLDDVLDDLSSRVR